MEELSVKHEKTQFIVVRFENEQYGIDIKYIDNIVRMQPITRVPKVQEYIKGVINLRGEVIPVMSVRLKMGYEPDEVTKSTRIIILKVDGNDSIGILVDEVKEVVTLENDEIEKISYDSKEERQNFLAGVGKDKGELISIFELHLLLSDKENN